MIEFLTSRDEIWAEVIEAVPSGFIVTEGKYGPGRDYYKRNHDLFDALHRFFDRKEADAATSDGPQAVAPTNEPAESPGGVSDGQEHA